MNRRSLNRKFAAACLISGVLGPMEVSTASAQEYGLVGTWRTTTGSPSGYGRPRASVVFTTTFFPGGTYRTTAVVEGGDGFTGEAGVFVMTGHYAFQEPSMLQYRLENAVLCVAGGYCSPSVPPGQRVGAVVSVTLEFNGVGSFIADGVPWTRVE
jgi:hypothetical protein